MLSFGLLQIKAMGTREKSADVDFSGVLEQEVEDALKAAAQISMGTEISEEDLSNIIALCDQVRSAAHLLLLDTHGCLWTKLAAVGLLGFKRQQHGSVWAEG